MVAQLTGEALRLVTLFLALITISKAGITLALAAQYPAVPNKVQIAQYVWAFRSLPFILKGSQPHDDFRGLEFWLEFNGDVTCNIQARGHKNNNTGLTESLSAKYSRIISTESLTFWMTTFSARLTSLTGLLPQSHDCSCYVNRSIMAPPPLWLQKHNDLRAHEFAHSPDLWRQPRLVLLTCGWSWRHCGINSAMQICHCKCTTHEITEAKVVVPLILSLGARWRWVVHFTLLPLNPPPFK